MYVYIYMIGKIGSDSRWDPGSLGKKEKERKKKKKEKKKRGEWKISGAEGSFRGTGARVTAKRA